MTRRVLALLLAGALTVTGCDYIYGVAQSGTFIGQADTDCLKRAVETTIGVAEVHVFVDTHTGWGLMPHWGPEGPVTYIQYSAPTNFDDKLDRPRCPSGSVRGMPRPTVQVQNHPWGEWDFAHTLLDLNCRVKQEDADAFRRLIPVVEASIEQRCGIPLRSRVKLKCIGVKCPRKP